MIIAIVFLIIGGFLVGFGTASRGTKKESISNWGTAITLAGAVFAYLDGHWKSLGIYILAAFVIIAISTKATEKKLSK